MGKTPKRALFDGSPSPFDWQGELKKITEAQEVQLVRTTSGASDFSLSADSDCSTPTPVKKEVKKEVLAVKKEVKRELDVKNKANVKFDIDWLKTCYTCKVAVWVGPKDSVIDGIGLACPLDTEWEMPNAEPYCAACWKKEDSFLEKISSGHKGKGAKEGKDKGAKEGKGKGEKEGKGKGAKQGKGKGAKQDKGKGAKQGKGKGGDAKQGKGKGGDAKQDKGKGGDAKEGKGKGGAKAKKKKTMTKKELDELKRKVIVAAQDAAIESAIKSAEKLPEIKSAEKLPEKKSVTKKKPNDSDTKRTKKSLGGVPVNTEPLQNTPWEVCLCCAQTPSTTTSPLLPSHTPGRTMRQRQIHEW